MSGTVLVSAGHSTVHKVDLGAQANGHVEAHLAVELRDMVVQRLRAAGVKVTTDGEDGVNEPLIKAIELARKADVAVEIHWNKYHEMANGIEVLCSDHLKPLAKQCAGAIAKATGLFLRGEGGWKAASSGQHKSPGFCRAGGLILEVCFIHNPDDMKAYLDNKSRVADLLAAVLAERARKTATVDRRDAGPAPPSKKPKAPAAPYPHTPLRKGARGRRVGDVQKRLRELSYDVAIDEDFGGLTDRAVRAFQRSAGLDVDGVVGRQTYTRLFT